MLVYYWYLFVVIALNIPVFGLDGIYTYTEVVASVWNNYSQLL